MPWFILSLSPQGERESSKSIIRNVKSFLGKGSDAYVPYVRGNGQEYRREFYLVEGYVFVFYPDGKGLKQLLALEDELFFEELVTTRGDKGERVPEPVEERRMIEMRDRVKEELLNPNNLQIRDRVIAIDGDCRNLEGEIVSIQGNTATVYFDFYSKEKEADIPLFCLERKDAEVAGDEFEAAL